MSEKLNIWNSFNQPPKTALKEIQAGRMKGKSDINPQWRYKAMTETFGVVGFGWKFTVDKMWTEPAANGETMAFVNVSVYINIGGEWSQAIPGTGGATLIVSESKGMYNDDDAYKKATTDALSTAMKMLGVAADIYMGLWDGAKYKEPAQVESNKSERKEVISNNPMTLEDAEKYKDANGELYTAKSIEQLQKIVNSEAAPQNKKNAALRIIENKRGNNEAA